MIKRIAALAVGMMLAASPVRAQWILVPMDPGQDNHLRAYGLTYWVLEQGQEAEWLLNYRGGSFLLPDNAGVRREAALRGVSVEAMDASAEARMRATVESSNMDAVPLEKAPKVAIYTPPNSEIWDDAVTMALEYAGIPYETVWDPDVLDGRLSEYEWLHLHHEDFTGQYSKFFLTYGATSWFQDEVQRSQATADQAGYANVPAMKKAVANAIRDYVEQGGFLFAMCSATETLELALAARGVDIAAAYSDGTPVDPNASAKMDWSRTMAFQNAEVQVSPSVSAFSDIDGHQVNTPWRKELGVYTLFDFSAKFDPVPSMLTQDHVAVLPDFYGLTTSFREDRLKPGDIVLAREDGLVKYVHGNLGEGTWTYFGGHDPEDPEHQIGDPPTDLALHPNSPGYRLILNNVLFPAAKKQTLKT
ncbi:MAG: asparagine synthetase B [Gemmatimonadota bacterium]